MPTPRRTLDVALPPAAPAGQGLGTDPVAEGQALLAALQATGAGPGEAMGQVALAFGTNVASLLLERELLLTDATQGGRNAALRLLDEVAATDPGLAQVGLNLWAKVRGVDGKYDLRDRSWITELPANLDVSYGLDLEGTEVAALSGLTHVDGDLCVDDTPLATLPDGLRIAGDCYLRRVPLRATPDRLTVRDTLILDGSAFVTLGKGLKVNSDLNLEGCPNWDGRIPADTEVGGLVVTDRHSQGLFLGDWRRLHPAGERP
jgi:hypothetical protein